MLHAGLTIVKADGISGLYAGIVPNLVGGGAAWGLYFLFYNAAKNFIRGKAATCTYVALRILPFDCD